MRKCGRATKGQGITEQPQERKERKLDEKGEKERKVYESPAFQVMIAVNYRTGPLARPAAELYFCMLMTGWSDFILSKKSWKVNARTHARTHAYPSSEF